MATQRLVVFRTGEGVVGYIDYDDASLNVDGCGLINPTRTPYRVALVDAATRTALVTRQDTRDTSFALAGPQRKKLVREIDEDGNTVAYLPPEWALEFGAGR